MKISKESQVVREFLDTDTAKLVGEFAAMDTHSESKYFYQFQREGRTFISLTRYDFCPVTLGENMLIHKYTIKGRTVKSYLVEYSETMVYVKSILPSALFYFNFVNPVKLGTRRVFPFRRACYDDTLKCLDYIHEQQSEVIHLDSSDITQLLNSNFIVNTVIKS
jgi:hypothetical protein